jgi:hypothetical protein
VGTSPKSAVAGGCAHLTAPEDPATADAGVLLENRVKNMKHLLRNAVAIDVGRLVEDVGKRGRANGSVADRDVVHSERFGIVDDAGLFPSGGELSRDELEGDSRARIRDVRVDADLENLGSVRKCERSQWLGSSVTSVMAAIWLYSTLPPGRTACRRRAPPTRAAGSS